MASSWQELTELLSAESRQQLARVMLEALKSSQWQRIDIEIRDHRMHAIDLTRRIHPPKVPDQENTLESKNETNLTSKI
ncbi:MAG: hypothetical protein A2136_05555 [Chloroflexi bacterium RBG_16_54_11]|nr:MAG: hypothetical protein A2136_05555 [Chloroflexi bacterium RBG_16_54_11]